MGLLSPLGSIDLLIICPGGRGGRPEGWSPPGVPPHFFVCFLIGWLLVWLWGGRRPYIQNKRSQGGALSLSYIHNRHSHRWGRGLLHPYHMFRIGVVRGGGDSSISYIYDRCSQEGGFILFLYSE